MGEVFNLSVEEVGKRWLFGGTFLLLAVVLSWFYLFRALSPGFLALLFFLFFCTALGFIQARAKT